MNKRDAQQHLVAYKDNQREKEYALQHGALSNFKAKYLEKIPLGNGKFRYIYEEAKDKVKSAANSVKNAVGTTTKINTRTTFSDPEANRDAYADKKAEDSAKRKLARQVIDSGVTTNLSNGGPNEKDARMQFAKQAVAENQNKVDYLNKQKNAKPIGANRADKIESQRDSQDSTRSIESEKTAEALKNAEKIKEESRQFQRSVNVKKNIKNVLGDDYTNEANYQNYKYGEGSTIEKFVDDNLKNPGGWASQNGYRINSALTDGDSRAYAHFVFKALDLSKYGNYEIDNDGTITAVSKDGDGKVTKDEEYFAKLLNYQIKEMYKTGKKVDPKWYSR